MASQEQFLEMHCNEINFAVHLHPPTLSPDKDFRTTKTVIKKAKSLVLLLMNFPPVTAVSQSKS